MAKISISGIAVIFIFFTCQWATATDLEPYIESCPSEISFGYSLSYAQDLGNKVSVHLLPNGGYIEYFADGSFVFHQAPSKHPAFVLGECLHDVASGICNYLSSCYNYFIVSKLCPIPNGSYVNSCVNTTVTNDGKDCKITASCPSNNPEDGYKINSGTWPKSMHPDLDNMDGSLRVQSVHAVVILAKDKALINYSKQISSLELGLEYLSENERKALEKKRKHLIQQQNQIIGDLSAGDIVTIDNEGHPIIVSDVSKLYSSGSENSQAISQFRKLSSLTGGILGISQSHQDLSAMVKLIFQHIIAKLSDEANSIEIAFVIDTTGSMSTNINQVKDNLDKLLVKLSENDGANRKVSSAIVEFRDKEEIFVAKVNTDLTTDFAKLRDNVNKIIVSGGGDRPEAVLDALLWAKNKLSWTKSSTRFCILIGDAPGHDKTLDDRYNLDDIIEQFRKADNSIVIYPVLSK